jgi:hypothetical protein
LDLILGCCREPHSASQEQWLSFEAVSQGLKLNSGTSDRIYVFDRAVSHSMRLRGEGIGMQMIRQTVGGRCKRRRLSMAGELGREVQVNQRQESERDLETWPALGFYVSYSSIFISWTVSLCNVSRSRVVVEGGA